MPPDAYEPAHHPQRAGATDNAYPSDGDAASPSEVEGHGQVQDQKHTPSTNGNTWLSKTKRIACMICRRRKLKCDGFKPSCGTCKRLGHSCAYDEVRRKSGPKRGYVKALEERLKQVETMLKTQDPHLGQDPPLASSHQHYQQQVNTPNANVTNPSISITKDDDRDRWRFDPESPQAVPIEEWVFPANRAHNDQHNSFAWEMIGLGLEEPLPAQGTIDELHQIYFTTFHPTCPIIHMSRYMAAMNLAPGQRPPVCLRYMMWTLACAVTEKYNHFKEVFYQRARKHVESDTMKGYGEHMVSVAQAQTYVLLALYEFRMMYFPRAWISTGNAVRLCQMTGLHRLDGAGLDVKQCLPPPRDWTEREERRRTFWMAFCEDRYASIGTGWPMIIDEKDVMSHLPASEEAFDLSRPEETQTLTESMGPNGAASLSSFGSTVLMACMYGRNLIHLHRPGVDDRDHDLDGEFWKRHRQIDSILLDTMLCLPANLKLPDGLKNPNVAWTNMSIHTSTICLHQAAIFKADKNRMPPHVSAESKLRCITAARETTNIMKMISHLDLSAANSFISFSLYVAARVFIQYLKSKPDNSHTVDSLRFILAAMNALKRQHPLTESFLVQLDVDIEALSIKIPALRAVLPTTSNMEATKVVAEHGAPARPSSASSTSFVPAPGQPSTDAATTPQLGRHKPGRVDGHVMSTWSSGEQRSARAGGPGSIVTEGPRLASASGAPYASVQTHTHPESSTNIRARSLDMTWSNELTPNSSTTPGQGGSGYIGKGASHNSGNGFFGTSPASSHHDLYLIPDASQGGAPSFSESSAFGIRGSLAGRLGSVSVASPSQGSDTDPRRGRVEGDFTTVIPDVWVESLRSLSQQSGIPVVADVAFGSFLDMDTMDITRWD